MTGAEGGADVPVSAGMLLLATPSLLDPSFADAVVLVLDADADGSLGVVLNRPTGLAVGEVLAPWADLVAEPEVLFQGGPVSTDGALAVALRRGEHPVAGVRELVGRLSLVDLDAPTESVAAELSALRIFAGYAGWGAGQLQAEIVEGSWYVVPAEPGDVFRPDTTTLWRDVMRRQPGDLAWLSTRPADADLN